MITKFYWGTRILGYIACLVGIFLYLSHQADAAPDIRNIGFGLVGFGFISFFISYVLHAWLRLGPRSKTEGESP